VKDLTKSGLSIVGILFAMLLLGYTGFQTFTLLLEVSGSPLIAAIGLIMFEAGMIYWWFVFRTSFWRALRSWSWRRRSNSARWARPY
jgi:hypothetical protein